MSYLPVPSRLTAAAMRVSLVARATNARRPPVPGVVSNWATTLGEAFFLAAGRAIPAVLSLAGRSYRKAGRAVERNARQNDAFGPLRRGCRGLLRAPEAEQGAGDAADLDLLGALGDAITPVVTVDVLERHVPRVADAAMNLDGAVGGLAHQPVGAVVRHRHPFADLHVMLAVEVPGGLAHQPARHLGFGVQLGEREL